VPLFERLGKPHPGVAPPPQALDAEGLRAVVASALESLLNTRCALTWAEAEALEPRERTVIDYGVPDLSAMDPASPVDCARLAAVIARTVAAFEPRLRDVQVVVERSHPRGLVAFLKGHLTGQRLSVPTSFEVSLTGEER